jgi:hypothetical protein
VGDTVLTVGAGVLGLAAVVLKGAIDETPASGVKEVGGFLGGMALLGLPFWTSAIYGYIKVDACQRAQRDAVAVPITASADGGVSLAWLPDEVPPPIENTHRPCRENELYFYGFAYGGLGADGPVSSRTVMNGC